VNSGTLSPCTGVVPSGDGNGSRQKRQKAYVRMSVVQERLTGVSLCTTKIVAVSSFRWELGMKLP
jgi:hypothetical protein